PRRGRSPRGPRCPRSIALRADAEQLLSLLLRHPRTPDIVGNVTPDLGAEVVEELVHPSRTVVIRFGLVVPDRLPDDVALGRPGRLRAGREPIVELAV